MAKRKTTGRTVVPRKKSTTRGATKKTGRKVATRTAGRKASATRAAARKSSKNVATAAKKRAPKKSLKAAKAPSATTRTRKAPSKKLTPKVAKKVLAPKKIAKKAAKKTAAPKSRAPKIVRPVGGVLKTVAKVAAPIAGRAAAAPAKTPKPKPKAARRAPTQPNLTGLDRAPIPSSLTMDRMASAARTGRDELIEQLEEHTETGPAITGGDIDANWEVAYSSGDEAPGGDNPTPDQDVVDDIGRALGVQYEDDEELKGADKISNRDKHRWELDPASSEDYPNRES